MSDCRSRLTTQPSDRLAARMTPARGRRGSPRDGLQRSASSSSGSEPKSRSSRSSVSSEMRARTANPRRDLAGLSPRERAQGAVEERHEALDLGQPVAQPSAPRRRPGDAATAWSASSRQAARRGWSGSASRARRSSATRWNQRQRSPTTRQATAGGPGACSTRGSSTRSTRRHSSSSPSAREAARWLRPSASRTSRSVRTAVMEQVAMHASDGWRHVPGRPHVAPDVGEGDAHVLGVGASVAGWLRHGARWVMPGTIAGARTALTASTPERVASASDDAIKARVPTRGDRPRQTDAIRGALRAVSQPASSLTAVAAELFMAAVLDGEVTPAQLGGVLLGIRVRGETTDELAGFVRAMRARALVAVQRRDGTIDTCGTGGDVHRHLQHLHRGLDRHRRGGRARRQARQPRRRLPAGSSDAMACARPDAWSRRRRKPRPRCARRVLPTCTRPPSTRACATRARCAGSSACAPPSTCAGRWPTRPCPRRQLMGVPDEAAAAERSRTCCMRSAPSAPSWSTATDRRAAARRQRRHLRRHARRHRAAHGDGAEDGLPRGADRGARGRRRRGQRGHHRGHPRRSRATGPRRDVVALNAGAALVVAGRGERSSGGASTHGHRGDHQLRALLPSCCSGCAHAPQHDEHKVKA